ncbi:MAG: mucoidy inhibitor MuiA family protein [Acidobacteriota bacterium]
MKEISTKLTEVTVFINKAKITRSGNISLSQGKESVSVTGLPRGLDPDSVRVKGSGTAPVKIFGIDVRKTFSKDIPEGIVRELTDKIEKLNEKKVKICDQKAQLERKQKHFDGLWKSTRIFASGFAKGEVSIDSHRELTDFLLKEGDLLLTEKRKKEKDEKEIDKEIRKMQEELDLANNSKPRERYTAEISVNAEKSCKFNIELTYHVRGASWKPEYDIRINEEDLRIDYMASVKQRTGEEWSKVNIQLSTFTPSATTTIPELDPWFISPAKTKAGGLDETRDSRSFAASAIMMPDAKMSYSEVIKEEFPEAIESKFEDAGIITSETSVTYRIEEPVSIPGDGTFHKVSISGLKLEKELKYITAPGKDERIFRIAEAVNGRFFLLPGKGQVFEDEEYIGPSLIEHTSPGEKFKIFSGSDDRFKVKRELKSREEDKKLLSDRKKIHYSFEITLENFSPVPGEILVKDQIPVPAHEDIKIRLEDSSPGTSSADDLNRFEWMIKVKPDEKKTIIYSYSIEFPREMAIPGLP